MHMSIHCRLCVQIVQRLFSNSGMNADIFSKSSVPFNSLSSLLHEASLVSASLHSPALLELLDKELSIPFIGKCTRHIEHFLSEYRLHNRVLCRLRSGHRQFYP
jgi:hypothetical protein